VISTEPTAHPGRRITCSDAGRAGRQLLAALAGGALLVACAATPAAATCTVGSGMGTCTEATLVACLPGGGSFDGSVVFSCGGAATITVTSVKVISANTTIDGGGLITIDGGMSTQIFTVDSTRTLNLQNLTVANANNTSGGFVQGGAITNNGTVTVTGCTFSNNQSNSTNEIQSVARGGAILNAENASLIINNSTFINNKATALAGTGDPGIGIAQGGALYLNGGNGTTTITNSTFSGNGVSDTGPGQGTSEGGVIYNGIIARLTLTNCTFIGNTGSGDDPRGGVIFQSGAQFTIITNCTFLQSTAIFGSCFVNVSGNFRLTNTIVANTINPATNCVVFGAATVDDFGHNMEDGTSCGFKGSGCAMGGTSFCNTNPQLDPAGLATNGGPTQTDALCTAMGMPTGCAAASRFTVIKGTPTAGRRTMAHASDASPHERMVFKRYFSAFD
jgi:hypothetical protein